MQLSGRRLAAVLLYSHINGNSEQQGQHRSLIIQIHQSRLQELHDSQGGAEHSRQAWEPELEQHI